MIKKKLRYALRCYGDDNGNEGIKNVINSLKLIGKRCIYLAPRQIICSKLAG